MKKVSILFLILVTFCSINLFAAKNLYLSYTKTPTNIYKNQKFEIKIEANIEETVKETLNETRSRRISPRNRKFTRSKF
jgi:hypothetical protein